MQHREDKTIVIQCRSRSLSPAEKNYSTLELELTAIVWVIQKCNFFLKGIEKFEVVTNHRPLVGIFAKAMPQIDKARITRLCEKILDRPFDVRWMAGKDNVIADALSRAPAPSTDNSMALPVSSCVVAPSATLARINECCQTDPAYRQVVNALEQSQRLTDIPEDHPACRLKHVWGRISLTDDGLLIVVGDKLYMPPGAREDTLRRLHESHCGYGITLQTARTLYYWPSMKYDIRAMIDKCEACQQLQPSKPVEPFITMSARFPMEQLSVDPFHVRGKTYMVTADRFSRYIWVNKLRDQYQGLHWRPGQDHQDIQHSPRMQDCWGATIPRAFRQVLQAIRNYSRDIVTIQSKVKWSRRSSREGRKTPVAQNNASRVPGSPGSLEEHRQGGQT